MKESDFRRALRKAFIEMYGKKVFTISFPSMYIEGGNADLYLCLNGVFVSIECKLVKDIPKKDNSRIMQYGFTPLQLMRAEKICPARGVAIGIIYVQPWKRIIAVDLRIYKELTKKEAQQHTYPSWDWPSTVSVDNLGRWIMGRA